MAESKAGGGDATCQDRVGRVMNTSCEHKFVYGGVRYEVQDWNYSGSGAKPIYYFDWFYCEKCLGDKYNSLDVETDTYSRILFGATPKKRMK